MASETIFSVTASLVRWEGVYEFTPHYSRNKHTIPLITLGERSAVSRRSAQLLNGDRKLFCMIRQHRAAAARSHARSPVVACFATIFVGKSSVCSMQRLIFCFLLCTACASASIQAICIGPCALARVRALCAFLGVVF